jgi:hypothetical protein
MMTRLAEWFATLATPNKAVMILVAIGLLVIAGVTALHVVDTLTETAEQKGAVAERAETQGKVIENVKAAKDAGEAVRRDGGPSRDDCLRDSRRPENC